MQRWLRDLEATFTTPAAPTARLDRQAFVQIALRCKRALEQPPFACLHKLRQHRLCWLIHGGQFPTPDE
jgi:hypothetical protein